MASDARGAQGERFDLVSVMSVDWIEPADNYAVLHSLAWLLAQKPWIALISGTTKLQRLKENIGAASVELTAGDLRDIEEGSAGIEMQGAPCRRQRWIWSATDV